jgi:hypothetical protein
LTQDKARFCNSANAAALSGDELVIGNRTGATATGDSPGEAIFFAGMEVVVSVFGTDGGVEFILVGNVSSRNVCGETATFRTPRDFKPSRCWIVASSSWP